MPFKRPVADPGDSGIGGGGKAREDHLAPGHTFSLAFLVSAAGFLLLFVVGTKIDLALTGHPSGLLDLVSGPGGGSGDSLLYIAQVVAAVLGVALTIVAIVVQLAANRYTPKIIDLFVRDPVNVPTLALFVVTVLEGIWVGHVRHGEFVPRVGVLLTLGLSSASLLVLLPYFRHVFRFLEPANVVHRIRDEVVSEVRRATRIGTEAACARAQARVLNSLDHLYDIARTSVSNADRTLATEVIFAFRDVLVRAYEQWASLPETWFQIFAGTTTNADFLNFPEPAIRRFEQERTWLERKVFWQLNLIYQSSVKEMRGVASTIALVTRELGEYAIAASDRVMMRLCFREFNTLLRSGLNAGDVRSVYNCLQQYRLLAERAVAGSASAFAAETFRHFRYYGRTAEAMGFGFILETATHDLSLLLKAEVEHDVPAADVDAHLELILGLARDSDTAPMKPVTRQGVRRSHCVLAVHMLARGREDLARRIREDLKDEPGPRIAAIREEILESEADFFELTERVSSFGYVPEADRPHVLAFFAALEAGAAGPGPGPRPVAPSPGDGHHGAPAPRPADSPSRSP